MPHDNPIIPEKYDYLLTGASGFLGCLIYNKLMATGSSILTLGRTAQNDVKIDLANEIPVLNKSFKTLIHASGKAHVIPRSQAEAEEFYKVNHLGTINLVLGIEKSGIFPRQIVFISTVAVYGCEQGSQIDETHALQGASPYAKSKIQAEEFLTTWCHQHKVTLTILRLPLIVGNNPPGNLGAMIRMMKKGIYLGIGSGKVQKSMVLADDVAAFIPVVCTLGGTYNLTDGEHPQMIDLESALANRFNQKRIFRLPDSMVRIMASVGNWLGNNAPINSEKYKKLTSSLTFSDTRARQVGWVSKPVLKNLPES